jgi:hypothetical protein
VAGSEVKIYCARKKAAEGCRSPRRWRVCQALQLCAKRLGLRLSSGAFTPHNFTLTTLVGVAGEKIYSLNLQNLKLELAAQIEF